MPNGALASTLLGALVSAQVAAPSASPTPQPLRVIVTVRSSDLCSSLRTMSAPASFVIKKNEDIFADLEAALPPLTPGLDAKSDPRRFAEAALSEKAMWTIAQNLALADDVLHRSWKEYPKGKDAHIDTMRQRLQNSIDLQRAITNDYFRLGHGDDDATTNIEVADLTSKTRVASARPSFGRTVTAVGIVDGLREADRRAATDIAHEVTPEEFPQATVRDYVRRGSAETIKRELDLQEYALASEIATALKSCAIP